MKKSPILSWMLILCMIGSFLLCTGCAGNTAHRVDDGVLRIVTTIFPPYDFAREITGGKAELHMLLKPGTESHSYEPSPADILLVESCDLFIYNGGESDTWVEDLLATIDTSHLQVLKMMDCVDMLEEEAVEGMQAVHSHNHGEECTDEHHHHEDEETHDEEHRHGEEEEFHPEVAEYDEHVWTSPVNAMKITAAIAATVAEIDNENAEFYRANAENYQARLGQLHQEFQRIVAEGKRDTFIFGDRFPFRYFAEEYGLTYRAAFPGCSAESEPGAKTVAYLIDKVRQEKIPNIFYIEFSNQKIALTIQEETGAKPLMFHSCHNLSADEMAQGITYLMLMEQNAENLKEALN
ncbi:MAG: metal ABC transporter substrate-binding protein [Clostridia bacterium]|nr:metal ABC transporter substrate-binding protein [Clostridia bacterium]